MFKLLSTIIFLFSVLNAKIAQGEDLIDRPPTGIAGLQCNQPEARTACDKIIETLYLSRITQPSISYLVDGTFSIDIDGMMNDISILTQNGRTPHITLYLVNGPAQRKCKTGYSNGFGARTCYKDWNTKILSDYDTMRDYQIHAQKFKSFVNFAIEHGAHVYICPMLEDNLKIQHYMKMVELIEPDFPQSSNLHYLRNPGHKSDWRLPQANTQFPKGFRMEKHPSSYKDIDFTNGIVTNDGVGFSLPDNRIKIRSRQITTNSLKKLRDRSHQRNNIFTAWNAPMQGNYSSQRLPANKRNYHILNRKQQDFLIQFLRGK